MVAGASERDLAQRADRPVLKRKLTILERGALWLTFGLAVGGFIALVVAVARIGLFGGRELRGYTPAGLLLGLLAIAFAGIASFYSARKRWFQESLPFGRATMMAWLWSHVALGSLALFAALAHAGFGAISANFSSGKLLLVVFALLVASGIVWRLLYRFVPPTAAPRVGNYAQEDALHRADQQLLEVEKLAAGQPQHVHALKDWMLAHEEGHALPIEVEQAIAKLRPDEQSLLATVRALAGSRRRALRRQALQHRYVRILQGMRIVHIPLTLACMPLIAIHAIGALDVAAKVVPLGAIPLGSLSGVERSSECRSCHRAIYDQWSSSMHAHALTSPLTLAQNNQLLKAELGSKSAPDPRRFCVQCHGPVGSALAKQDSLPFDAEPYDRALLNEGIGCSACHQRIGATRPAAAGLAAFRDELAPGSTYVAEIADPVGNAHHRSERSSLYANDPNTLCASCHTVAYDFNNDGAFVKGEDLVLQTTTEEYDVYRSTGGRQTCIGCHMPTVTGKARVAEAADIPFEQDEAAPARELHDHGFVGVDYPLDVPAPRDGQRDRREALLRSAAKLELEPPPSFVGGQLALGVRITNVGAGHNLPTGFAFARQMWLEVKITDGAGRAVFSSGVLANASDDLCDAGTLDEEGSLMRGFVRGCTAPDPQLVNFQQKLYDKVEVARDPKTNAPLKNDRGEVKLAPGAGAHETWLQRLACGVVTRVRPSDKQSLGVLGPGEARSVSYRVPGVGRGVTVSVRLMFRNVPAYLVRALAANQPPNEKPQLAPLLGNLQVVEMAAVKQAL